MNNSKLSSSYMLKITGCLIFDIAIILAYFKAFGLFFIIFPVKSAMILLVLLTGLVISNGAVIFPGILFKTLGIPYTASAVTVLLLYSFTANILSVFLIPGSAVWYLVWQLIVFAFFLAILSLIGSFSARVAEDTQRSEREKKEKTSIILELMEIERALEAKGSQDGLNECLNSFKALKERIQASTPFGRIIDNDSVLDTENQIKNNLASLSSDLKGGSSDTDLSRVKKVIDDTRKLVIIRETLNIK